ncbi:MULTISPECIES: glycosyltransferase family protein [Methylomonas]|uniref:glycosyltransferase family protein n=1 Tax=Methylomonas TaxID=416 RepID=UPI00168127F4|nr:glycosyltransferase [Methylomonas rhizoryzae]
MPKDNPWYWSVAAQIAQGFSALGLQASYYCGTLTEAELAGWVACHKPQLIFDMNCSRADRPGLGSDIFHICWVVDFNGRSLEAFAGSDITYLFAAEWLQSCGSRENYHWLPPGVSAECYFPQAGAFSHIASFVGHIPKPWSEAELQRNIAAGDRVLRFADVLPMLEDTLTRHKSRYVVQADYNALLSELATQHFGVNIRFGAVLDYDLSGRLIRLLNRRALVDQLVEIEGLAIYGPDNWALWPQYRPFYQRFLSSVDELRAVYNQSQINFHEGCSMHFRVVDAMACRSLLFVKNHGYHEGDAGLDRFFEPGVHYVAFQAENLIELYQYYSNNTNLADKVRDAAFQAITAQHTWRHRAEQIIEDLAAT